MKADKAEAETKAPTGKRKRRGAAKRSARRRVGDRADMQPLDAATPARSAAALEANARAAVAGGRKERADAETNVEAFHAIKTLCVRYSAQLGARGMPVVVTHGAELVCEQLAVIVEVESLSRGSLASSTSLDDAAFVAKRRDAVIRVAPGPSNSALRAGFGIDKPVRAVQPASLRAAALGLLAGKKAFPRSRAAKLITADDEKRLRAMARSITTSAAETKAARAARVARTSQRDILNTALELFYDDFAAGIGLVLEGDELARLQALGLVPRRTERRASSEEKKPVAGGGSGSAGGTGAGSGAAAGGSAPAPSEKAAVTA